eukprot:CAMPEP_0179227180 /NCGR_PEP_ID=MMETSP0797-20121207/9188_1 /TAXON_ID=47934 /ORGANISM="Dinophysis acuminata, Strain DAEP01" /LENGTH=833 /DNA_ID=CAMNT_0020934215 /DNA_START=92 /DNA_END=2593 /DNA_ORIENTATION=-
MLGFVGGAIRGMLQALMGLVKLVLLLYSCHRAYSIRLSAVNTFGYIIHEFDPWFNFRAAQYLAENGWHKFFHWYDYMSWYPIGRPVGTTIYPGMQIVSVWIWEAMKSVPVRQIKLPSELWDYSPAQLHSYMPDRGHALSFGPMSLNDVCVMVPAWFGGIATFFTFFLTAELSGSSTAGVFAAFVMAIIPAHMMRSAAGEFDNEAVAVTTFLVVLWLWCRSVRTPGSWVWGPFAGVAYMLAAATWGGYIFVNNLVALHAALLVVFGKYSGGLYRAYTLYYVVGTLGATFVPVIGLTPFRSVEQMPSLLVFLVYQILQLCDTYRGRLKKGMEAGRFFMFRVKVFTVVVLAVAVAAYTLMQLGAFMPLGARIRGLFLETVKTGNPLVDSVAEHHPTSPQAYEIYLLNARYLAAVGFLFCWHQRSPGKFLAAIYAIAAYHYSLKMSRLMIICGPIVSVLAGFPVGIIADWCWEQVLGLVSGPRPGPEEAPLPVRTGGMGSIIRTTWRWFGPAVCPAELSDLGASKEAFRSHCPWADRPIRAAVALAVLYKCFEVGKKPFVEFVTRCDATAPQMANVHLAYEARLSDGTNVIVDDYLKGYEWLRDNTPADARVMAWWDYGYQITGVANRTSIADGNTWNHEHIATLGRILTSSEKKSHNAMRHLADYVLVWAGGQGDDMAKSPHLARIGNSVFPDHCGDDDPLCNKFSFYRGGEPTPMMARSFLYKAVNHNLQPGVKLNQQLWKEVHTTKYGLMRIFEVLNVSKESKEWLADPANRECDAPGSWYCIGQYPPALQPLIAKRNNFAQLEDFNKRGREKSAYTKLIEDERAKRAGGGADS